MKETPSCLHPLTIHISCQMFSFVHQPFLQILNPSYASLSILVPKQGHKSSEKIHLSEKQSEKRKVEIHQKVGKFTMHRAHTNFRVAQPQSMGTFCFSQVIMGQNSYKRGKHYCRLLAYMLKDKRIKVPEGIFYQFLYIIIEQNLWFPDEGTLAIECWGRVSQNLKIAHQQGKKLHPNCFYLWRMVLHLLEHFREAKEDISPSLKLFS